MEKTEDTQIVDGHTGQVRRPWEVGVRQSIHSVQYQSPNRPNENLTAKELYTKSNNNDLLF